MTYKNPNRMAMTAIAAVLALSSTPLLAQDTPDPATDTTVEPVTATPDPLAPEPAATEATVAPDATVKPEATSPAAPVAHRAAAKPHSSATHAASTARAPAPEPAPVAAVPAETPPMRLPETVPVAAPIATAVPPTTGAASADEAQAVDEAQAMDNSLEIAGVAGLGLLALTGAGLAMRRRKRRAEEADFEARQQVLAEADAEPAVAPQFAAPRYAEPTFARAAAPIHDPVPSNVPVTALPEGFDLSRFGPHVQAAYRGPTPDNPSLSLKYRLRRASFLDQQARRAAKETPARLASGTAAKPAFAARNEGDFLFRRAGQKPATRPAFQS